MKKKLQHGGVFECPHPRHEFICFAPERGRGKALLNLIPHTHSATIHTIPPRTVVRYIIIPHSYTMTAKTAALPKAQDRQIPRASPAQNAVTLSFNGVDFRLIPSSNNENNNANASGISMVPNTNGKFTMINLASFTGSLIVSASALTEFGLMGVTPEIETVASSSPSSNLATTVEDEPSTPNSYAPKEVPRPLGQQQLTFEKKKRETTTKKRVSSFKMQYMYMYLIVMTLNSSFPSCTE